LTDIDIKSQRPIMRERQRKESEGETRQIECRRRGGRGKERRTDRDGR